MRNKLMVAALLATTCLTPVRADAGPVVALGAQFLAGITGAGAAVGAAGVIGGALGTTAYLAGASIFAFAGTALGGFLVNAAISYGLSAIAQALAPKPPAAPSPSDRLVNFAQPVTPMEWVFGRVRKGGPFSVTSFQLDRRHYSVILAAHEIDGVEQWFVDGVPVLVGGDDIVETAPYSPHIRLKAYTGGTGQVADPVMAAAIPEWTSAHDMAGLAHVAAFAKRVADASFAEVYGNSGQTGPVLTPVIRGALVYDPRTETTGYSNNAALVWAWVTENRLGAGTVDWDDVAIEADAADVLVTNKEGGTQRKWTLNGTFPDSQSYDTLVQQMILACDGHVFERPNGTVGFKVGRYEAPTVTLTDDDFFGFEIAENDWGQDPKTEFAARYVEPGNDWNESASGVWVEDEAARANRETVSMYFSDSHNQTSRAIKRTAKASRPQYRVTGQIGPIALDLLEHRFVRLQIAGRDFVGEISKITPAEDDATFEIVVSSTLPSDWDFVASTEEPDRPVLAEVTNDNTVPAVATLTGTAVAGPGIKWQWPAQEAALNQEFRTRQTGEVDWQPSVSITDDVTDLIIAGLVDGQGYEAEIRNVTAARRPSAWVASGAVTAVANSTPPAPVEGLEVTGGAGGAPVVIEWATPNDPNHDSTRIYRATGAGAAFGSVALVASIFGPANVVQTIENSGLAPATYEYWATSANASGVESTLVGPEQITVT